MLVVHPKSLDFGRQSHGNDAGLNQFLCILLHQELQARCITAICADSVRDQVNDMSHQRRCTPVEFDCLACCYFFFPPIFCLSFVNPNPGFACSAFFTLDNTPCAFFIDLSGVESTLSPDAQA